MVSEQWWPCKMSWRVFPPPLFSERCCLRVVLFLPLMLPCLIHLGLEFILSEDLNYESSLFNTCRTTWISCFFLCQFSLFVFLYKQQWYKINIWLPGKMHSWVVLKNTRSQKPRLNFLKKLVFKLSLLIQNCMFFVFCFFFG